MKDGYISKIVQKFRLFEEIDEVGFAKVAGIEDIARNGYVLTPICWSKIGDYDERTFDEKMRAYSEELSKLLKEEES